jgi:prepilin-type N-terminal cleavage/methylation domain-containing protein
MTNNPRTLARRGFTLIELLIVIAIIAVLVAVLAVALFAVLGKSKQRSTEALLMTVGAQLTSMRPLPDPAGGERFRKDAGSAGSLSGDAKVQSSQVMLFYISPSEETWRLAPAYKGKAYAPPVQRESLIENIRNDSGKLEYYADAWGKPLWFKVLSGNVIVQSAGENGTWNDDDDMFYDGKSATVKNWKDQ